MHPPSRPANFLCLHFTVPLSFCFPPNKKNLSRPVPPRFPVTVIILGYYIVLASLIGPAATPPCTARFYPTLETLCTPAAAYLVFDTRCVENRRKELSIPLRWHKTELFEGFDEERRTPRPTSRPLDNGFQSYLRGHHFHAMALPGTKLVHHGRITCMSRSKVTRGVTVGVRAASCVYLHLVCVRRDFAWFPWFPLIQRFYWKMAPVVRVLSAILIGR